MATSPWPMTVGSLLLREAGPVDIERLLTFRNAPDVNRYMIRTHVDPDVFRRDWLAIPDSDTDFSCVGELGGVVVAMGYLEVVDAMGQPGAPRRTEGRIGYVVDPEHWGRGVGSGLARGLLAAAFERIGLRRVVANCNADNLASVPVLEGVGMRREQHCVEETWHCERGWIDGYGYAMLDREWPGVDP